MTNKEKLVRLQQEKKKLIIEIHGPEIGELYHTFHDEEIIYSWENEKNVNNVLYKIINELHDVINNSNFYGFPSIGCPFCFYYNIYINKCYYCLYGKKHGKCNAISSNYKKVYNKVHSKIVDEEKILKDFCKSILTWIKD